MVSVILLRILNTLSSGNAFTNSPRFDVNSLYIKYCETMKVIVASSIMVSRAIFSLIISSYIHVDVWYIYIVDVWYFNLKKNKKNKREWWWCFFFFFLNCSVWISHVYNDAFQKNKNISKKGNTYKKISIHMYIYLMHLFSLPWWLNSTH